MCFCIMGLRFRMQALISPFICQYQTLLSASIPQTFPGSHLERVGILGKKCEFLGEGGGEGGDGGVGVSRE